MYESVMIECGAVQKAILACRKILQSIAINCKFKTSLTYKGAPGVQLGNC